MFTRKIYVTGTASGDAVATLIVPSSTRLMMVQWAWKYDINTDNAYVILELSVASAKEIGTNNAQQCISETAVYSNFVTSGLAQGAINLVVPVNVPFKQGQNLYLHALVSGTVGYSGGAVLWFK